MGAGPRAISPIENIHGIPFPALPGQPTIITEKLAHTDIFLKEPVLAKKLKLTVTFSPGNLTKLEVGVRENSFWLSYPKVTLYAGNEGGLSITKTITIPLTDKLADKGGSVDLMFFATNPTSQTIEDEGIADQTLWQLYSLKTEVFPTWLSWPEVKDYIKSIITREKAQ